MFLDRDERLILFNQRPNALTLDSLKSFQQAGIKTVQHDARWVSWHELEPSPGKYNWSVVDELVDTTCEAGLKVILDTYWRAPDWVRGCFDQVRSEGTWWLPPDRSFKDSWRAVDPYDEEAMGQEAEFLKHFCERYSTPNVLCRYAMYYGGERILPFAVRKDYTEQFTVETVLRRQRVFAKHSDELWTSFHPYHASPASSVDGTAQPYVGNEHIKAVYEAMHKEFPDHTLNIFLTEFFTPGTGFAFNHIGGLDYMRVWVGAQFLQGVIHSAGIIKQYPIYGLVMAHRGIDDHCQPDPSEFERVEKALEILADV